MRTLAGRVAARFLAVLITVAGVSGVASAQQMQASATSELLGFFVRGVDSAFDPVTRTYLVVGGAGTLLGICINEQGVPITGPMVINNTGYGAFPRAKYGAGGFLVVWPEEVGNPSQLRAATVNCSGAVGPEQVISGDATAWLESGAALVYSSTSQRFLVAWKSFPGHSPVRIKATLVDLNGTQFGPVVDLSSGFGRDPGATWNPYNDHFGVSFSGETGPNGSVGFSSFALVPATNPAAFGRLTFNAVPGGLVTISDIDFNIHTGRFVMTWFEITGGLYARIAELDAVGNLLSSGIASGMLGSYDALSLAYNPVTGTFGLVGLDRRNDNVLGLELNARGYPFNGENTIGLVPRTRPGRYTRVASSTTSPTWNSTFSIGFGSLGSLIAGSFAGGGGPPGSFDAPPPAPPPPTPGPAPSPSACPGAAPVAGWVCVNGGWLPPDHPLAAGSGAPAPPPVPPPTPSPGPSTCPGAAPVAGWLCVNGGWLPPDHPLAAGAGVPAPPPPVPGPPPPVPVPSTCLGGAPVAGWLCVNSGWLPPDHPLAAGAPAPAPAPAPSSCTTPQPGVTWYCVNGGWVPPNSPLAPGGACVGAAPAPGWVCTGAGGWVPPNHPLAGGGGDD